MRSNDPSANGANPAIGRQWDVAPNTTSMAPRSSTHLRPTMGSTNPRRVTTTSAQMPSMRSVMGQGGPIEPGIPAGLSSARMRGVAVGTVYETDSQSAGSSRTGGKPAAMAATVDMTPSATSFTPNDGISPTDPYQVENSTRQMGTSSHSMPTSSNLGYSINAPYQDMMLHGFGHGEDPSIERARTQMASHAKSKEPEIPAPKPGLPHDPTSQAKEPKLPSTRLGRRILSQKLPRQPDFVKATLVSPNEPLDFLTSSSCYVECVSCGATLHLPSGAVVLTCPSCDQVRPVACCRIIQPPRH